MGGFAVYRKEVMADGDWKGRSFFIETRVTEKGGVILHMNLTEGEYTTQEAKQLRRRLDDGIARAERVRKSLRAPNKKAKNVNK